jgi:hypothetical protein
MALFKKLNEEKGEPKLTGKALAAEEKGKGEMMMPKAKKPGQYNLPKRNAAKPGMKC